MGNVYIEKFENRISWITFLSIPAIYVWLLYCYELGKAYYFGIPYSLVSVKITEFYTYTIWNGLLIVFMTGMILLTGIFYDLFYVKTKYFKTICKRIFVILCIRSGLLIYVLVAQYNMLQDLFTLILYSVVLFGLLLVFALLDYRFMIAPAKRSKEDDSVYYMIINRKNAYTYYVCTLVVQILIYIPIFYFAYGYNHALSHTEFLSATVDGKKQLIIAMYDDCYIVKSIEDVENRNMKSFKKIDPHSVNGQELEWITVSLKDPLK